MTVLKVLELFDSETENDISVEMKKRWISELDMKISCELNKNRQGLLTESYTPSKSDETELLAVDEYAEIYVAYLRMKMNYILSETERYNNSAAIFNRLYYEFANYISRNFKYDSSNSVKVELNDV